MNKLVLLMALSFSATAFADVGISYKELWNELTSDEYQGKLPQRKIFHDGVKAQAERTLSQSYDLHETPLKTKQAHPNGICLAGTWTITEKTQYTGAFASGTEMLMVARASTAMNNTKHSDSSRTFGFAGKLFPTTDESKLVETGNFFSAGNLGGEKIKYYVDAQMTNSPPSSITRQVISNISYATAVKKIFSKLDNPAGIRQLYQLSEINGDAVPVTPKYIRITGGNNEKVKKDDFRNELDLNQRSKKTIEFTIEVGEDETYLRDQTIVEYFWSGHARPSKDQDTRKVFKKVGVITIDRSVRSESCDLRLHFAHPKFKKSVRYGNSSEF